MWAYLAAYELPHDDPAAPGRAGPDRLPDRRRPGARARRAADAPAAARRSRRRAQINRFERVLVWCHWMWFIVPHASVLYVLRRAARASSRRAAARMYAVFDLGADLLLGDPDRAARGMPRVTGRLGDDRGPAVRRMMIEYGEQFWGDRWAALYDVLGGNPAGCHAVAAFRHVADGRAPALRGGSGGGRRGVDLRGAARAGARLPRRALRGRSARRAPRWPRPSAPARRGWRRWRRLYAWAGLAAGAERRPRRRWGIGRRWRATRVPGTSGQRADTRATTGPAEAGPWRRRRPSDLRPRATEEMPRVVFTRRRLLASVMFVVSAVAFLYFVLPKLLGLRDTWNRIQHGNVWWLALAAVLEVLLVLRLHRPVPGGVRPRRVADRLARELSDHDGRAGRHAAVRLRRRRRDRADRVGGAPLRDGAARRRLPDDRVHGAAVRGLHGGAGGRRAWGSTSGSSRVRRRLRSRSIPAIFGAGVIAIFLAVSLLPGDFDRLVERWTHDGRLGRLVSRAGRRAGGGGQRRAHRDRPGPRPRSERAGRGRLVGVRHRRPVGVLSRLRRLAADGGDRDVATSSACSATRCRCPAGSAASTAA